MSRHRLDLSEVEAAWLAGLLDGEGCFDAPKGNPRIRVKMTDLDVVIRAADLMGATTHGAVDSRLRVDGRPRSRLLVAQVTGKKALDVMHAILPYLGSRRSAKVTEIICDRATSRGKVALKPRVREVEAA